MLTICTLRPLELRCRATLARIPLRLLSPQPEGSLLDALPRRASNLLIDTVGMPPLQLASLLAQLQRRKERRTHGPAPILGAIVDQEDLAARRLVALSPAVRMLVGDDLPWSQLAPWARQLHAIRPISQVFSLAVLPLPALPLHPCFLTMVAALARAESMAEVAEHCAVSPATMKRILSEARRILHLPTGREHRFLPSDLAEACLQALARQDLDLPRSASPLKRT
ncbi:MAG TPA: hypothetical protein VFS21_37535 [Roseiflexaceae bacterium]|nr:hypothetical protein [Roseiflexaceae bacterium]